MASIIKKKVDKTIRQDKGFLSNKLSVVKSWTPQKKKIFVFALLFVLAIPCFVLLATNIKNNSDKFSSLSLFNANLDLNGQKDVKDSLSQAIESTKQVQDNLDIVNGIESGEISTSDIQEMLNEGIITQEDLEKLSTSTATSSIIY